MSISLPVEWTLFLSAGEIDYNLLMRLLCYALIALFFANGCVSITVHFPEDPEVIVDYSTIRKAIPDQDSFEKEIPRESIHTNDPSLYAIVKVVNCSQPLSLQWYWYNPENKLKKKSKPLDVNQTKKYLQYFAAWDSLQQHYFLDSPGKWKIVIFRDGRFFYQFTVDIIKSDPLPDVKEEIKTPSKESGVDIAGWDT